MTWQDLVPYEPRLLLSKVSEREERAGDERVPRGARAGELHEPEHTSDGGKVGEGHSGHIFRGPVRIRTQAVVIARRGAQLERHRPANVPRPSSRHAHRDDVADETYDVMSDEHWAQLIALDDDKVHEQKERKTIEEGAA